MRRAVVLVLLAGSGSVAAGCSTGSGAERTGAPTPVLSHSVVASSPSMNTPRTTMSSTTAPKTTAPATSAPALPSAARRAGLVDVRSVVPDAIVDLRYATTDNFTGVRLYPRTARCLVHEDLAPGLRRAAALLRAQDYRLVFWDCYRPRQAQERMFAVVPDPAWVARPGPYARSHTAARSVDVTLARRDGTYLDMGTDFDSFKPIATAYATAGLSDRQLTNRRTLREAMQDDGSLSIYSGEWWHFDGPGAAVDRPHLDVPLD